MLEIAIYATILGLIYAAIQLYLRAAWKALPITETTSLSTYPKVVVIIPARNEAQNIKTCLQSVLAQDYPKDRLEVILVDDHSEDRTIDRARSIENDRLTIIDLEQLDLPTSGSPKKRALNRGIEHSKADIIVTTDADCVVPLTWIASIVATYEQDQCDMVAAPVLFDPAVTGFERFQALDFVGMMGITGAGFQSGWFHMCNGANLSFTRSSFEQAGGYEGADHIASGDDILLAQKYIQQGLKLTFLKSNDAVVYTRPESTMSDFFAQRLRWGAKSEHYHEKKIVYIQFVVLLMCLSIVAFLVLLGLFFKYYHMKYIVGVGILLSFKFVADYLSLRTYTSFFKKGALMKGFLLGQCYHIFYIAVIGFLSVFVRNHTWKGRRLR